MELAEWVKANQICCESLDIHLQYWRAFLADYPEMPLLLAASPVLAASFNRHIQLVSQSLQLLDQQGRLVRLWREQGKIDYEFVLTWRGLNAGRPLVLHERESYVIAEC